MTLACLTVYYIIYMNIYDNVYDTIMIAYIYNIHIYIYTNKYNIHNIIK